MRSESANLEGWIEELRKFYVMIGEGYFGAAGLPIRLFQQLSFCEYARHDVFGHFPFAEDIVHQFSSVFARGE